ncbi:hypothetical protein TNCT_616001, partial [Trichonephila clavata]
MEKGTGGGGEGTTRQRRTLLQRRPICGLFMQRLSGNGKEKNPAIYAVSRQRTEDGFSLFTLRLWYG